MRDLVHRIDQLLHRLAPGLQSTFHEEPEWARFELEPPESADYAFTLHVADSDEPQISAELLGLGEHPHFWYWPFESPDYRSPAEQFEHFEESLGLLLFCPTRIIQTKRLFMMGFRCEAREDNTWKQIGGNHGCLRLFIETPRIQSYQRTYSSPALVEERGK